MTISKIRIKRTSATAITTGTLAVGELGYSSLAGLTDNTGDRLFIGLGISDATSSPIAIGGKYFTDKLSHTLGTLTPNTAILVDAQSKIDAINVGNITITGNNGVISATNENGNITLTPNGTGYVSISGTNGVVIPSGSTAQQGPSVTGAIRYNTTISAFEGYSGASGSGQWASLGGVKSVDGLTSITAESSPGASDDVLHFYAGYAESAVEVARLNSSAFKLLQTDVNTGSATSGALQVAGGVGIAGNTFIGGALSVVGMLYAAAATFTDNVTISGSATAANKFFRINNSTDTTFEIDSANGNTSISGTLAVIGATNLTGALAINTNKFTVASATGNTAIAGTLTVTGITAFSDLVNITGKTTLADTLAVAGDLNINTNKFNVVAATGNTSIAGNVGVSGTTALVGNLSVNNNKFTVDSATGDTAIAGTLNVTGASNIAALSATSGAFAGNLSVNTNKFTVASATGNTAVGGKLTVSNDFELATNKFTVAAATGNTEIAGTLAVAGATIFSGAVELNGNKITGLGDPTNAQDAVSKTYVDSMAQGLHVHAAVDFVTTTDIATTANVSVTYTAGAGIAPNLGDYGPGSYLTFSTSPTFSYYNAVALGNEDATFITHTQARVLVVGQADAKQNGIYVWATATTFVRAIDANASYDTNGLSATLTSGVATVTLTGGKKTTNLAVGMPVFKVGTGTGTVASAAYIVSIDSDTTLTLSGNHPTAGSINFAAGYGDFVGGDYVYVSDSGYGYAQSQEGVIFGTSNIIWYQFAGQGSWVAGDGLSLTGNSFSVNTANGITINGGNVQLASSVAGNGLSLVSGVLNVGGTANRITSTGTSVDIASTYVGQSSITTVGTITTGVWTGSAISAVNGGTGFTGYTTGDMLYASSATSLQKLAKGDDGQVLMMDSGVPTWSGLDGGIF